MFQPFPLQYELTMTNLLDQLISNQVQNWGKIIMLWEKSFGDFFCFCRNPITKTMQSFNHSLYSTNLQWSFDFGSSSKLGEDHNVVRRLIWWVFSKIQLLKPCNVLTNPFRRQTWVQTYSNWLVWRIDFGSSAKRIIMWWDESFVEFFS